MDMTYISWEQNHIDTDIGHIYIKNKKMQWTTQIYQKREKKK